MSVSHYDFPARFLALYEKAVDLFANGQRGAATFFNATDLAWLSANGLTAQHLYDYAEDDNERSEPGFDHALAIEIVRRDYFLNVQGGQPSGIVLNSARLPAKTAAMNGIAWLPRILPKARAKLRGELPPDMMYCCGGDRAFFRRHDILPAEFLSVIWRLGDDDEAIAAWVARRSRTA